MMKLMTTFRLALCMMIALASAQAARPLLIPRAALLGNPERTAPLISPDGTQLSWLAPDQNGVVNVWTSALDGAHPRLVTNEQHQGVN